MFSPAWRIAVEFDNPIPPKPMTATLRVRLGGRYPTPPSTWRGTIIGATAKAAAAVAPSRTKVRREIGLDSSVIARDPVGAGDRKWMEGALVRNALVRDAVGDGRWAMSRTRERPDVLWRSPFVTHASRRASGSVPPVPCTCSVGRTGYFSGCYSVRPCGHRARHQPAPESVHARQGRHRRGSPDVAARH